MGLSEEIVAAIRAKYIEGATYAELSAEAGVSAPYIRHILNGKRDPMKLSLDFFLRLFPSARIELDPSVRGAERTAAMQDLSCVSMKDYQALREKYQDLRDKYQDLREEFLDYKSRPPFTMDGSSSRAPYPALSTLSPSNK